MPTRPRSRSRPAGRQATPASSTGRRARWPISSPAEACRSSSAWGRADRTSGRTLRHSPQPSSRRALTSRRRRSGSRSWQRTTTTPRSVADAAAATAQAAGTPVVARATYDLTLPDFPSVMAQLQDARPDVVILASHIPDGVAFRRAMIAANLRVGALIGSTMAECDPDFAGDLGPDAVGVFASDRPTGGFRRQRSTRDPCALRAVRGEMGCAGSRAGEASSRTERPPRARHARVHAQPARPRPGRPGGIPTKRPSPASQPAGPCSRRHPTRIRRRWGRARRATVAAAARPSDLHIGSASRTAPASTSPRIAATLGQNERAAAVIWQWQAVRSYTFVWPPTYATGQTWLRPPRRGDRDSSWLPMARASPSPRSGLRVLGCLPGSGSRCGPLGGDRGGATGDALTSGSRSGRSAGTRRRRRAGVRRHARSCAAASRSVRRAVDRPRRSSQLAALPAPGGSPSLAPPWRSCRGCVGRLILVASAEEPGPAPGGPLRRDRSDPRESATRLPDRPPSPSR